MEITEIEILNYKSVKAPVGVRIFSENPTVLIGKNGSGKTNILEALASVFSENTAFYPRNPDKIPPCKIHISLSNSDFSELFPKHAEEYNAEKCRFVVANDETDGGKADRIRSDYLVRLLLEETEDIRMLAQKLNKALEEYKGQLLAIDRDDFGRTNIYCHKLRDSLGKITNYEAICSRTELLIKNAENFCSALSENSFDSGRNTFVFNPERGYLTFEYYEQLFFRLEYAEPALSELEKKYITVNSAAIKAEIEKINADTEEICERINGCIREIRERALRLEKHSEQPPYEQNSGGFRLFEKIYRLISQKCLFLKNESRDVAFYDQKEERYCGANPSADILNAYIKKRFNTEQKAENRQSGDEFRLSDTEKKRLEDELNLELPSFENGMYDRVSVALDEKHRPEIFLHEKSGDKISLNMTSAGRRWYFTYYFMKRTLEKGDVFIIDEPAAMLHPLAQRELCGELLQLQKQGIKVIYSTHSPYLIPEQWSSVHFVTMGEKGTEAFIDMPQKKVIEKIIGKDIFDVQKIYEDYLNIDKKILAAKCYNAVAKAFDNIDAAYSELTLSEYTLESWKKKRKKPKFENVLLICEKTGKDIMELLNSD